MEEQLIRDYAEHRSYPISKYSTISGIRVKGEYVCFEERSVFLSIPEKHEIELISLLAFVNWRVSQQECEPKESE